MFRQTVRYAPVSERAIYQRIKRRLKKDGEELRAARSPQQREELGDHFTVQAVPGGVYRAHVKLEKLGRELGVLRPWEGKGK